MPLRLGKYSDIPQIASVLSSAFYDEELNDYLFPHRKQYPDDYVRAWKQVVAEKWWNYHNICIVSYDDCKDDLSDTRRHVIKGVAIWSRTGSGSDKLWCLNGPCDPRLYIYLLVTWLHTLHRLFFPNRSIRRSSPDDPKPLRKWEFGPVIWPFISPYFTQPDHRRVHWELSVLGVKPGFQREGVGKDLVAWGLKRSKEEELPAVVVTAAGTEGFYRKQGFEIHVATASQEDIIVKEKGPNGQCVERKVVNPLKRRGIGGGAILWTKEEGSAKPDLTKDS